MTPAETEAAAATLTPPARAASAPAKGNLANRHSRTATRYVERPGEGEPGEPPLEDGDKVRRGCEGQDAEKDRFAFAGAGPQQRGEQHHRSAGERAGEVRAGASALAEERPERGERSARQDRRRRDRGGSFG
jgi:hypothetical protein